jgi:hypothetical protein
MEIYYSFRFIIKHQKSFKTIYDFINLTNKISQNEKTYVTIILML